MTALSWGLAFAQAIEVYIKYAPRGDRWAFSSLHTTWVAHSIYFQMLGEHGFVGFGLFVTLWLLVWRRATTVAKGTSKVPDLADSIPLLMSMTQVSLIGYAVGGAFLSLAYLDLPLYLMAYVLLSENIVKRASKACTTACGCAGSDRSNRMKRWEIRCWPAPCSAWTLCLGAESRCSPSTVSNRSWIRCFHSDACGTL